MPTATEPRARFRLGALLEQHTPGPMTQAELSRRSGVGSTTINRMVANKTGQVSLRTLTRLAAVLGCEPGDLIEGGAPPRSPAKRARKG